MKHWTKKEAQSAKLIVQLEFKSGKVHKHTTPAAIRVSDLSTREYNAILNILTKHGKNHRKRPANS